MTLKKVLLIFHLLFFYSNSIHAQNAWNKRLGIWINIELDNRLKLNQPFDSTANVIPRFLWLRNLNELEIENRFEQKGKYLIKKISNDTIIIANAQFFLRYDTIVMKDKYHNVVKFIKYK